MQSKPVLKHHADLVDKMAETLGIDLEEAVLRGNMEFDEVSDAVLRCTGCSNPDHCAGWLAAHSSDQQDAAPGYCRNLDLFNRLKPE